MESKGNISEFQNQHVEHEFKVIAKKEANIFHQSIIIELPTYITNLGSAVPRWNTLTKQQPMKIDV